MGWLSIPKVSGIAVYNTMLQRRLLRKLHHVNEVHLLHFDCLFAYLYTAAVYKVLETILCLIQVFQGLLASIS